MKSKARLVKTGDIIITSDVIVKFLDIDWPLFVVIGQQIHDAKLYASRGMMMYDVLPAHLDHNSTSIMFDVLDGDRVTIPHDNIKLVVGKTNQLQNNDDYRDCLAAIVPDAMIRNDIYALEDEAIISNLIEGLDECVRSDPAPGNDDQIRLLFRTTFQRNMNVDAAERCVDYFTKLGRSTICDLYKLDVSEYLNTMKHLKETIKKSK